jgi:hypothetical protein
MANARIALASSLRLGIGSSIGKEKRERDGVGSAPRGARLSPMRAAIVLGAGALTIYVLMGIETSGLNPT